jgi:hypothetical protein
MRVLGSSDEKLGVVLPATIIACQAANGREPFQRIASGGSMNCDDLTAFSWRFHKFGYKLMGWEAAPDGQSIAGTF